MERTEMRIIEPPITNHPSWCDHAECIPAFIPPEDTPQHRLKFTGTSDDIQMELSKFDGDAVAVLSVYGEADMTLPQVDEFIKALTAARDRLAQVH
jgi:hypothetical protein